MSNINLLDGLAHPEFFETIDRYPVQETDFLDIVREMVTPHHRFQRLGVWFLCQPPSDAASPMPVQGWKIHVSARGEDARQVLAAAVPVLLRHGLTFKFALDRHILNCMNSKPWVRQGGGKFLTVYPRDVDQFRVVIQELAEATTGLEGPYILSDRRYADSRVVYYRYGGMRLVSQLAVNGHVNHMLVAPGGELVPDRRLPYFVMPPWADDPFGLPRGKALDEDASSREIALKDGRYVVTSALRYSNGGGVYAARDTSTGNEVIIKEGRPHVRMTEDSTALLRKEFRILTALADFHIAPQPIDFFQDWEHVFLVMERVRGISLGRFSVLHNVTIRPEATLADTAEYYRLFRVIFLQLAEAFAHLHRLGIIFADLSPSNVLVDPETLAVRLIDFEAAFQMDSDRPVPIVTEGYAFIDQMVGQHATFASDRFALGALMHACLWPINQMFMINPKARFTFVENVVADIGFPVAIRDMITALLDKDIDARPSLDEVIRSLRREDPVGAPWTSPLGLPADAPETSALYDDYVSKTIDYIMSVATPDRKDRLFPADGALFRTNPLSVAYGACGVAYAMHAIGGRAPASVVEWILASDKNPTAYPPGLYVGLSGIAWTLLELGLREAAEPIMKCVLRHPLRYDAVDLFEGATGWGLASLRFFLATEDEEYLQGARDAARWLRDLQKEDGCWQGEKDVPLGLAHGASGTAMFFLYLSMLSKDDEYLSAGRKALDFDIAAGLPRGSGLSWPRYVGRVEIVYPYWRYGSAGVGMAALRYHRLLQESRYRDVLERIVVDTATKYSILPGFFKGMSGKGEFLLDLYAASKDPRHLDAAHAVASGVTLYRIEKSAGLAFPGESLRRISCDFGTGSAGIAHFLHRLTHPEVSSAFNLDALFDVGDRAASNRVTVHI